MMDYWKDCIAEAFEYASIQATSDQVDAVASWAEGAHDNYRMALGHDCIPNPIETEVKELKAAHAREIKAMKEREQCYRQSVATRRGTKPENVWLENGEVLYR